MPLTPNTGVQPAISFSHGVNTCYNETITARLIAMNKAHLATLPNREAVPPAAAPIEIYALDAEGTVIGGLIGRTNSIPYWLEITVLWVDEPARGSGIGRRLVEQAEQEAVRSGCRSARLATGDYQAPGFYAKMGYNLYGTLENCPPGVTCYYFRKDLGGDAVADDVEEGESDLAVQVGGI